MKDKMYCIKCRTGRTGGDWQRITFKNGKKGFETRCEKCGELMYKMDRYSNLA